MSEFMVLEKSRSVRTEDWRWMLGRSCGSGLSVKYKYGCHHEGKTGGLFKTTQSRYSIYWHKKITTAIDRPLCRAIMPRDVRELTVCIVVALCWWSGSHWRVDCCLVACSRCIFSRVTNAILFPVVDSFLVYSSSQRRSTVILATSPQEDGSLAARWGGIVGNTGL